MKLIAILQRSVSKARIDKQFILEEEIGAYEYLIRRIEGKYDLADFHKTVDGYTTDWYKAFEDDEDFCRVYLLIANKDYLSVGEDIPLENGEKYIIACDSNEKSLTYLLLNKETYHVVARSAYIHDFLKLGENELNYDKVKGIKIK